MATIITSTGSFLRLDTPNGVKFLNACDGGITGTLSLVTIHGTPFPFADLTIDGIVYADGVLAAAALTVLANEACALVSEDSTVLTYVQFKALYDTSQLITGKRYLLSDHQTIHIMPFTTVLNINSPDKGADVIVEPIIVTAASASDIEPFVVSTIYPEDVIEWTPDSAWYGDLADPLTKGAITYRRVPRATVGSTQKYSNTEASQDFRHVVLRRWEWDGTLINNKGLQNVLWAEEITIGTAAGTTGRETLTATDPANFEDFFMFKEGSVNDEVWFTAKVRIDSET